MKAEKERLESLAREKGHADKLKAKISDMNASIASKETEYQEAKKLYEALARSNRKFEEGATKFREIYIRVENLEKDKQKYQEELAELRPNVEETDGMPHILRLSFGAMIFLITLRHRRTIGRAYQKLQCSYCRTKECPTSPGG